MIYVACDETEPSVGGYNITSKITKPITNESVLTIKDVGTSQWLQKSLSQILTDVKAISGQSFNGYYLHAASGSSEGTNYRIIPFVSTPSDDIGRLAYSSYIHNSGTSKPAGVSPKTSGGDRSYRYSNGGLYVNSSTSWSTSIDIGDDGKYYSYFSGASYSDIQEAFPVVVVLEADTCYINGVAPVVEVHNGAGSGYVGNALLSNKKMVGFNVPTSDIESTKTESTETYSATPTADTPKAGNGFARIKWLRGLSE